MPLSQKNFASRLGFRAQRRPMGFYFKSRRQKFSHGRPRGQASPRRLGTRFSISPTATLFVYMADKKPVWEDIVRKHGLQPLPYEQVSSWPFADAILGLMEYDDVSSTIKARQAGFHDCIDTEEMFLKFFADLRRM